MPTVTLSAKHQLTVPVDIVRKLGLRPGDKLAAELVDDHLALLPQPDSWARSVLGSARGVYGTKEEIDEYLAEERDSPERREWREDFEDLFATDENVRAVVEALRSHRYGTSYTTELLNQPLIRDNRLDARDVGNALEKLVAHGGVRRIPLDGAVTEKYRLVREFTEG